MLTFIILLGLSLVIFAGIMGVRQNKQDKSAKAINNFDVNQKFDFVAFDFETATPQRNSACSLGLAFVKDNKIVGKKLYLIQPPGNVYNVFNSRVNGMTEKDTANAPTFDKVWEEVHSVLETNVLFCHNRSFDYDVLMKSAATYNIVPKVSYDNVICTYELTNESLKNLCLAYDIDCSEHHNADIDAAMCAELVLKIHSNYTPDWSKEGIKLKPKKTYIEEEMATEEYSSLSMEQMVQDLSIVTNPNTIFYKKSVVITGTFSRYTRDELALIIRQYGASIRKGVSTVTKIICIGENPGPAKMKRLKDLMASNYKFKILHEQELYDYLDSIKE